MQGWNDPLNVRRPSQIISTTQEVNRDTTPLMPQVMSQAMPPDPAPDSAQDNSAQDKIRQQFDYGPYPRIPLDTSPKGDYNDLFRHSLVTAAYLRHRRVVDTHDKVILDAGCGSGYKALVLALANPGAKIVGIDLSEKSVELARQRLQFHGVENAEFYPLKLEQVGELGLEFDYINCDEVLYLLPDPAAGLRAMKSVLKPDGILRTNLHSLYQRFLFYRAQTLFQFLGLLDTPPGDLEETVVIETMNALKNDVRLKAETWMGRNLEQITPDKMKEYLGANFLLIGDTGYTIPQLFALLEQVDLEFVSMVEWRHWDVTELFQDPDNLPAFWGMSLATASIQERLHVFELLHPVNRLLDFWCAHPGPAGVPVDDWSDAEWQTAVVHLHPQLRTADLKDDLIRCIQTAKPFEISRFVTLPTLAPVLLEASVAACLLPLWDGPQPIQALAERYRQVRPVDPVTLEPVLAADALVAVREMLNRLDAFLYVLLESA